MIRRSLTIWLCLLAVWLQIFAPAAAMDAGPSVDSLSVICSHATAPADDGQGGSQDDRQDHDHQHCLLCQSHVGGLLVEGRPTYATFDYPVSTRLPRVVAATSVVHPPDVGRAQPRGPPISV